MTSRARQNKSNDFQSLEKRCWPRLAKSWQMITMMMTMMKVTGGKNIGARAKYIVHFGDGALRGQRSRKILYKQRYIVIMCNVT